jgi:hypothetical protein
MNEGLLWYDASAKLTPQQKLAEAAARFAERFGQRANCCHVHPSELFADPAFTIVPDAAVLPHHLWVGRDESLVVRRPRRRSA